MGNRPSSCLPLQTVAFGDEQLHNLNDDGVRQLPLPIFSPSRTEGIWSVGNLRFCAGCRLGSRSAVELKSKLSAKSVFAKSSVSELVAELCTVSLEVQKKVRSVGLVVQVGLIICGEEVIRPDSQTYSAPYLKGALSGVVLPRLTS